MRSFVLLLVVATTCAATFYTGVNQAGYEFDNYPDTWNVAPYQTSIQWWAQQGANVIRVPFRWDRAVNSLSDNSLQIGWSGAYFENVKNTVNYITSLGMVAILDCHNYARYPYSNDFHAGDKIIGVGQAKLTDFTHLWNMIAQVPSFKNNNLVWFGLMNEPVGYSDPNVATNSYVKSSFTPLMAVNLANAGISGIRNAGANNKILVAGTVWTGVHSWFDTTWYSSDSNGLSNALAFEPSNGGLTGIQDSMNNWALEVHTYLDQDHGGDTTKACVAYDIGFLTRLTQWASGQSGSTTTANPARQIDLFLGEFGFLADSSVCYPQAQAVFNFLAANSKGNSNPSVASKWLGWTYWAAGPNWGSYAFSIEPQWNWPTSNNPGGKCNPDVASNNCQMVVNTQQYPIVKPYFAGTPATGSGNSGNGNSGNSGNTGNSGTCVNSYTPTQGPKSGQTQNGPVGAGVQCGDQGNWGSNQVCCQSGLTCTYVNPYWSECRSGGAAATPTTSSTVATSSGCSNAYTPTAGPKSGQTQYGPAGAGVQCGDQGNWGSNQVCCQSGYTCTWVNNNWSECRAGSGTPTTGAAATTGSSGTCSAAYGQCGGNNWAGPYCCQSGTCVVQDQWYSQCKPSKKRFSF